MKNGFTASKTYDREVALRRLNGEISLFCDLVGFYFEDADRYLEDARLHLSGGRALEFGRAMHRLKGLASNFEARPLVAATEEAEDAGRDSNLEEARRLFVRVEHEARLLMQALESDRRLTDH